MSIKIKKLHPEAIIPTYATDGAGCFDLYAYMPHQSMSFHGSHVFDTGLAFEIPSGFAMLIYSRSGHGFKSDVRLANCVGIIDSDYRSSVKVKLTKDDDYREFRKAFTVTHGDRIAQAMIIPVPKVTFTEVDELSETTRGDKGFGSTGA